AEDEKSYLRDIEKLTKQKIEHRQLPVDFVAEGARLKAARAATGVSDTPERVRRDIGNNRQPAHPRATHRARPAGAAPAGGAPRTVANPVAASGRPAGQGQGRPGGQGQGQGRPAGNGAGRPGGGRGRGGRGRGGGGGTRATA
ncbi:MAG: ATP-dependent helicase, partial [Sphingomonas sp.]